jgi:hypothetical protein
VELQHCFEKDIVSLLAKEKKIQQSKTKRRESSFDYRKIIKQQVLTQKPRIARDKRQNIIYR